MRVVLYPFAVLVVALGQVVVCLLWLAFAGGEALAATLDKRPFDWPPAPWLWKA